MLGDDDLADVVARAQHADAANQVLLLASLEEAAAGVRVASAERGEDLLQPDVVRLHAGGVDGDFVLLDESTEADDVGDAGNQLELAADHPILKAAQVRDADALGLDAIAVDLADRRRERCQLGLHSRRQVHALEPFEHLLPREVVVRVVVEGEDDVGEPELSVREEAHGVGQAAEADLQRYRDLLLDFFRRVAGKQADDRDLDIGDVGERLDRQGAERRHAGGDEQRQHHDQHQRLVQRSGHHPANHWVGASVSS